MRFKRIHRSLGIATSKRRYDLPLNKDGGGLFLKILIALMSFLAILALSGSFALSAMKDRWSSGLENKASIEIRAQDEAGGILTPDQIRTYSQQIYDSLSRHPAVETVSVMSEEEISSLVAPWLGDDMSFDQIPLPGILTVSFKENVAFDKEMFENSLKSIAPMARLDTHESWLNDVLRFTGALKYSAILITLIIGLITVVAIAGAVQSRMAVYREELELLHLMGASDSYISRQLQRYIFILCLQGAAAGTVIGGIALLLIGWFAGEMDISLIPDFSLGGLQILILVSLPVLISILATVTARHTVLRTLSQMP